MTKEQCIEKHSERHYPSDSSVKYDDWGMRKAFCESNFSDGWDACENTHNEMMCKFAEWMDKQMYCLNENSHWYNQDDLDAKLTTQELLTIFKQSLKQ